MTTKRVINPFTKTPAEAGALGGRASQAKAAALRENHDRLLAAVKELLASGVATPEPCDVRGVQANARVRYAIDRCEGRRQSHITDDQKGAKA